MHVGQPQRFTFDMKIYKKHESSILSSLAQIPQVIGDFVWETLVGSNENIADPTIKSPDTQNESSDVINNQEENNTSIEERPVLMKRSSLVR
ncbi:hypothetical protein O9G_002458 [Rozella allomycis CSF55]|uniref:Uncharacterized protein n=1 Tax=Rozella allomycis (strain CSF55) TaxID=988480 RepID=A0A075AUQ6_ROZAC|nr:hypothetical protein O9G_002458 [Rozella allomycis CSF55]|eukprot:EPZ33895.1 hypothetical protein O9G_002458 [Rozella allomycis CSF55]